MAGREILTLQFGHYSNFVGTHWWNIQELGFDYDPSTPSEINHDILFREGLTTQGQVTFTPRLLLVDLHGSLGTLQERGGLYDPPTKTPKPDGSESDSDQVEVHEEPQSTKNQFLRDVENIKNPDEIFKKNYNLDNEVKVWSDYLYTRFHPRTVNIIKEYQFENENTPFDAFTAGADLWKTRYFEDDFTDKIRQYIEECDALQGFHVLTDVSNGFAGLSSSCLQHLRDEYDKKSVLVFPCMSSYFSDYDGESDSDRVKSLIMDSVRTLNTMFSFEQYYEHSNLFVPLCLGMDGWRRPGEKIDFRYLKYNEKLPYHTSAILATALETLTVKHRLKSSNFSLVDLCADLSSHGRKAAAATLALPFPIHGQSDLLDCLDNFGAPLTQSITPSCTLRNKYLMQHYTLRGISEERLKKPMEKAGKQREMPAYRCTNIQEMLHMFLAYSTHATTNSATVVYKPVSVKNPFPKIFRDTLDVYGNIKEKGMPHQTESVPVMTGLHCGSEVGHMLLGLYREASRIKIGRLHQYAGSGLDDDDVKERLNNLLLLRENYEDDYI